MLFLLRDRRRFTRALKKLPFHILLVVVIGVLFLNACTAALADQSSLPESVSSETLPEFTGGDSRLTTTLALLPLHEKRNGSLDMSSAHNYLFEADADNTYQIDVTGRSETDVLAQVFDPQGALVTRGDNSHGTLHVSMLLTANQSGLYTLRIAANIPGDYQTQVSPYQGLSPIYTGTDTTHATMSISEIALNQETPTSFSSLDEARNFLFDAAAGEPIIVQVRSEGVQLHLVLLSPDGHTIAEAINQLTTSTTTSGRHTLRVEPRAFAGDRRSSGPIMIRISKKPDP